MIALPGAELPAQYQYNIRTTGGRSGSGAARSEGSNSGSAGVTSGGRHPELISRAQMNAALDACIVMLPPQPGAGPDTAMSTPSASDQPSEVASEPVSDAATVGSTETAGTTAMETEDQAPTEPTPAVTDPSGPSSPSGASQLDPASQYAVQLEQLRAMGFSNDAQRYVYP